MNLLFICGKNKRRSPTAEVVFSEYHELETRSAGVDKDSDNVISIEDIEWADIIYLMENVHKKKLNQGYSKYLKKKKIIVLDIPDKYQYMEPLLIEILKVRVNKSLKISNYQEH